MKKTLILGTILGVFLTGCQVPDQLANFKLPDLSMPSATSSSTTKNSINDEYDGNKALAKFDVNNMNRAKCIELEKLNKKFEKKFCEVNYAMEDVHRSGQNGRYTTEKGNFVLRSRNTLDRLDLNEYQKFKDLKRVCKNKIGFDWYSMYYCPLRAKY